jgi:glycine hydroxymethyltransferase
MGKDFENPMGEKTLKGELKMMSTVLNSGVFPGMQGGPLEHVIAAKAIAFGEALTDDFAKYAHQVIVNAQAMAKEFSSRGYSLVSGGTENHLMLIDLRNKDISGRDAEKALGLAEITVNKNMVPFDDKSPLVTSGIRIGTSAITTRGLLEADCLQVVDWIDTIINNASDTQLIEDIGKKVNRFMSDFRLY